MTTVFENQYGTLDRIVHRFAFATASSQVALADLEDRMYADRLRAIDLSSVVFITGLPRAGTTLLLELCSALPEFCSHCYRDMPFVLCPLLWDKFSTRFRRDRSPRERAHGDGMLVSPDSPEAFEEMIWKLFWRDHYKKDRIEPWENLDDTYFSEFLGNHFKKIIALRNRTEGGGERYLSKNNGNIARVSALLRLLPASVFVIPFRNPLQQSASLLRQHRRFLTLHTEDRFAKAYMKAIGHFDFGENLRPINFDGWFNGRSLEEASALGFWLDYWSACYSHLLGRNMDRVHFISYENLSRQPATALERLADVLDIEDRAGFHGQAGKLSPAKPHDVSTDTTPPDTVDRAMSVFGQLEQIATV